MKSTKKKKENFFGKITLIVKGQIFIAQERGRERGREKKEKTSSPNFSISGIIK